MTIEGLSGLLLRLPSVSCVKPRNIHILLCAGIMFLAPNAIFSSGAGIGAGLGVFPAALACIGAALAAYVVLNQPPGPLLRADVDGRALFRCLLAAVALCILGGSGHFLFGPFDIFIRDSVLADIVKQGFPAFYRHDGVDYVLRAPLGTYMFPAIVGRAFGLGAAHIATLVQNVALYAAILYLLLLLVTREKLRFLLVFMLFASIDVIPRLIADYLESRVTGVFEISPNLMFWTSNPYFGHIASLFWTPNHALPGWFFGVLALLCVNDEIDVPTLGFAFCALLFWSPLAMMGGAPFLFLCGLRALKKGVDYRRLAVAAAAALCLLPIVDYLRTDSETIPRRWAFGDPGFLKFYALTLVFSIPQIWLVIGGRRLLDEKYQTTAATAIVALAFLPFYKLGVTPNNDMTMRVSIIPVFMLGFCFSCMAHALLERSGVMRLATTAVIALSALTSLFEVRRGLVEPVYAPSDCNILTVHSKIAILDTPSDAWVFPYNYLARTDRLPRWLAVRQSAPATLEKRVCWPDYQLLPPKYP